MATSTTPAGLYLDGGKAILPGTSLVGELQVFQSNVTELVALGGIRQRLFGSSQGDVYAQLLLGGVTGYSGLCGVCSARATELGLGANVTLNDRWAVRVRGDIRAGGSAGEYFYPMLGGGITRRWGSP